MIHLELPRSPTRLTTLSYAQPSFADRAPCRVDLAGSRSSARLARARDGLRVEPRPRPRHHRRGSRLREADYCLDSTRTGFVLFCSCSVTLSPTKHVAQTSKSSWAEAISTMHSSSRCRPSSIRRGTPRCSSSEQMYGSLSPAQSVLIVACFRKLQRRLEELNSDGSASSLDHAHGLETLAYNGTAISSALSKASQLAFQ